jgi:hypothetical protein
LSRVFVGLRPPACIKSLEGFDPPGRPNKIFELIYEPGERMAKRYKFGIAAGGFSQALLFAVAVVLGLAVSARAQSSPYVIATSSGAPALPAAAISDEADEPILTIKKRVDEVNVLFIATDRHGKFVRNLNENDFSILDDHKPVESILNFRRETDLPIELGLLMDVSGSVEGRFGFEKEAATGFLQHLIRPGYDRAFVVGFNKESRITQDFTRRARKNCCSNNPTVPFAKRSSF